METVTESPKIALAMTFGAYFAFTLGIAIFAQSKNASTEKEAEEAGSNDAEKTDIAFNLHFMGGKGFGTGLAFLTMFSTSYSGYTVSGIPRESALLGFFAFRWVIAYNTFNVVAAMVYPRLRRVSAERNYSTNSDAIADMFDNRILSMTSALMQAGGQLCYMIAQLAALKSLLAVLFTIDGKPVVDMELQLWLIGLVLWLAESIGGFGAVALTDAAQSSIMILAMIALPIVATAWFGGAHNSVGPECANLAELNCNTTYYITRGAACAGKTVMNGCLAHTHGYLTLHPTTGFSEYFKPLYPAGIKGFDTIGIFNHMDVKFWELVVLFFGMGFMPNVTSRVFSARTDDAARKNQILMTALGGLIATLPALLMGIMVAANVLQKYPAGSDPYGAFLSELMNMGGFWEFLGVAGGVATLAAIMSTADSSAISVSNTLISEFLMNWWFVLYPGHKKPIVVKVAAKVISFCTIITCVAVTLYDPVLNDPANGAFVMAIIGVIQAGLFMISASCIVTGLFMKNSSDWAAMIGQVCGIATMFYMATGPANPDAKLMKGSSFAILPNGDPEPIKTTYFGAPTWAAIVTFFVTVLCSLVPLGRIIPTPSALRVNTTRFNPAGGRLTHDEISKIMEGTREPVKDRIGITLIVVVLILANVVGVPWFGESYDGCNFMSYASWLAGFMAQQKPENGPRPEYEYSGDFGTCKGGAMCAGLPCWTWPFFVTFALNKGLVTVILTRWKPIDTEALNVNEMFALKHAKIEKRPSIMEAEAAGKVENMSPTSPSLMAAAAAEASGTPEVASAQV